MTCVVGLVAEGKVWMGADSAGVSGWDLRTRADPTRRCITSSSRTAEVERRPPTAAEHLELQENGSIQHLRAQIRRYWASDYSRR